MRPLKRVKYMWWKEREKIMNEEKTIKIKNIKKTARRKLLIRHRPDHVTLINSENVKWMYDVEGENRKQRKRNKKENKKTVTNPTAKWWREEEETLINKKNVKMNARRRMWTENKQRTANLKTLLAWITNGNWNQRDNLRWFNLNTKEEERKM